MDTQKQRQQNLSEIAQFLEHWGEEVEAIRQGLEGFAITSRHEFITRRMQSFADERMIELMTLEAKKYMQNGTPSSDRAKSNLVTDQERN
jgi:hypothetical protein